MKNNLLLLLLLSSSFLTGQVIADFEDFSLTPGEFLNDAAGGVFTSGNVSLPNTYN